MKIIFTFLFLLIASCLTEAQTWNLLPDSPTAPFRHDDLFFINADTGWVVNVDGYIYKTTDGGNSFDTMLYQPATSFRCVGFANSNRGWAGNLGIGNWSPTNDTMPLYETFNGGSTWQPVTNITGNKPKGICGISVVNDSVVYAVGRVGGPCYIMKTSDGGTSWTSVNFAPPAYYLIDCHFFSADTGIVVGCTGTSWSNERYAIFHTTNGGQLWQQVASSPTYHGHCWKISFPSRNIGYVSIEAGPSMTSVPVLKTTDGGLTWNEKIWNNTLEYEQGIGFVNDSTGWCGSALNQVRMTTDGGDTWNVVPFVENFNRFRFINDSTAYACGTRIFKYTNQPISLVNTETLTGFTVEQNRPNPFNSKTTISYTIPARGKVSLKVYDFAGRFIKSLVETTQNEGTYSVDFSVPYYFDTHFFYTISFGKYTLTKNMLMIK